MLLRLLIVLISVTSLASCIDLASGPIVKNEIKDKVDVTLEYEDGRKLELNLTPNQSFYHRQKTHKIKYISILMPSGEFMKMDVKDILEKKGKYESQKDLVFLLTENEIKLEWEP